ncbi:hypothetical protein N658DRAFT_479592 [Parathielavia hyrcaniae]|uniref:Uncharacterized protein n=1 Tax=Parathielavia hyrcaniae TaxID=113614 RepID=A0AAN6PSD3_9PEZI|nr:hypothetical protein N658DRAFT_479592 [Parathielavia hyrcaniae]
MPALNDNEIHLVSLGTLAVKLEANWNRFLALTPETLIHPLLLLDSPNHSFRLTTYLPVCGALFTAGFALREVGAFNYGNVPVYLVSTLLVYMSPPILELANYHILGRTLYYVPYCSPIHPGRVLTTPGSLSAIVEGLNGLGLAVILSFYALAGLFHARCARRADVGHGRVRAVLVSLFLSKALILARTVYRTVEHFGAPMGGGTAGQWHDLSPVIRFEWFFWVFEAAPMLANVFLWNARHPRRYLPRSFRRYLAQDGDTELDGPGWADKRSLVMTLLDPFGFLIMCEKGRAGVLFWKGNGYDHLLRNGKGTGAGGRITVYSSF